MTLLASITEAHISFECPCGHAPLVAVSDLFDRLGRDATFAVVKSRARCSKCGGTDTHLFRIVAKVAETNKAIVRAEPND